MHIVPVSFKCTGSFIHVSTLRSALSPCPLSVLCFLLHPPARFRVIVTNPPLFRALKSSCFCCPRGRAASASTCRALTRAFCTTATGTPRCEGRS